MTPRYPKSLPGVAMMTEKTMNTPRTAPTPPEVAEMRMRTVCPARFASLSFAVAPSGIGTLWTRSRAGAGAVGGSSVSVGVTLAAIVTAAGD